MKKIAIVNQRYGKNVNGGSELYARLIAEHLSKYYDVEVITTTALDYTTWDNYFDEGVETINGVNVRRFKVDRPRNMNGFVWFSRLNKLLKKTPFQIDKTWIKAQGPYSPDAIAYIRDHKDDYDAFIFVTYLYYLTAMGLPEVADKTILIPTAHDEWPIYMKHYKSIFTLPRGIVYLTDEEKEFVQNKFNNDDIKSCVAAVGIDVPEDISDLAIQSFRRKYNISGDYIIYAGRVDVGKSCDEMFAFWARYKAAHPECDLKLVILGKQAMDIPEREDLIYLGFVSDDDKYRAIAGAKVLWLPSKFESLSIALLEGMALGVPGLVNGKCEVLKGHADKSQGALYYMDYNGFEKAIDALLLSDLSDYDIMSEHARDYVNMEYRWESVEDRLKTLIEEVINDN